MAEYTLASISRYIAQRVEKLKESIYAMTGEIPSPAWLSKDYLLSQFSKQRKTAIRKYQTFVEEGMKNGPIWSQLKQQIYLGDRHFIERAQKYLEKEHGDIQIPRENIGVRSIIYQPKMLLSTQEI